MVDGVLLAGVLGDVLVAGGVLVFEGVLLSDELVESELGVAVVLLPLLLLVDAVESVDASALGCVGFCWV